jgi:Uncharacterised nucleotidyltransferase
MGMKENLNTTAHLRALALLVFSPLRSAEALRHVARLDRAGIDEFFRLADIHHVVIRALQPLALEAATAGQAQLATLAQTAVDQERQRIDKAVAALETICNELETSGCPVAVMKTLDHWPDFGNDLDLVMMADERRMECVFLNKFNGRLLTRTVGDYLAHKRSFELPGLHETVEVHVGRLGQAGEHTRLARRFIDRRRPETFNGRTFLLPAPEERIIEGTLERMYRHLYFRLCDILDTARIVESESLDYEELRAAADLGGIWTGVATYLRITSEYVREHRGTGLNLPNEVMTAARFGKDKLIVRSKYLWVPLLPQSLALFARQFAHLVRSGNLSATARLSLLPPLASIAVLAFAVGANSERIW